MPKITVNGVSLAYEIVGENGPPVIFQDTVFARNPFSYFFAGRMSSSCRVLLLDRRNRGASDIAIEDTPCLGYHYTDDLHHVLQGLNMSPAYVGGGAMGASYALLMAHRYPEDVKGLILGHIATDDRGIQQNVLDRIYFRFADIAETQGMQSVIADSQKAYLEGDRIMHWVAKTVAANPSNRDRLLAMNPKEFAAIIRKWGEWALSERLPLANLPDEELNRITVPAIVAHGFDPGHPEHTARQVYEHLPNAEWVDYSKRFSPEKLKEMTAESCTPVERLAVAMPYYENFIKRVEAES